MEQLHMLASRLAYEVVSRKARRATPATPVHRHPCARPPGLLCACASLPSRSRCVSRASASAAAPSAAEGLRLRSRMAAASPPVTADGSAPWVPPAPRPKPRAAAPELDRFVPLLWLQRVKQAASPELRDRHALVAVLAASLAQNDTGPPPDVRTLQAGLRLRLRRLCDGCACPTPGAAALARAN